MTSYRLLKDEIRKDVETRLPGCFSEESPAEILISDSTDNLTTMQNYISHQAASLLQTQNLAFQEDLRLVERMESGVIPEDCVEFAKWITDDQQIQCSGKFDFICGGERTQAREKLFEMIASHNQSNWLMDCVRALVGEFYMNAYYDAPREGGRPSGGGADLEAIFVDKFLLILCRDSYGSLDSSKFFTRLNEVYQLGTREAMNMGHGGAGIGCQILFENCISLMQFVWEGKLTVTVGRIPLNISYRKFLGCPKNIITGVIGGSDVSTQDPGQ